MSHLFKMRQHFVHLPKYVVIKLVLLSHHNSNMYIRNSVVDLLV